MNRRRVTRMVSTLLLGAILLLPGQFLGHRGDAYAATSSLQIPLNNFYNNDGIGTGQNGEGTYDGDWLGHSYVPQGNLPSGSYQITVNNEDLSYQLASSTTVTDNVSESGQTIPVNASTSFSNLWMLASATNVTGTYASSTLTVNYTDGSSARLPFQVSDWIIPGNVIPTDELQVYNSPDWMADGTVERAPEPARFFAVNVPVDPSKVVKSFVLDSNRNVHIWGMTLNNSAYPKPPVLMLSPQSYQPAVNTLDKIHVFVADKNGNPVPDATVNLTVNGPGTLSASSVITNSNGAAQFSVTLTSQNATKISASINGVSTSITLDQSFPALNPTPVLYVHGLDESSASIPPGIGVFLNTLKDYHGAYKLAVPFVYTDTNPNDGFQDISKNGDSQPHVQPNSALLHTRINDLYKQDGHKPIVLFGYSMGAAIIRGDLSLYPNDSNKIKFIVFLNGALQGSYLLPIAKFGLEIPFVSSMIQSYAGRLHLDLSAPAETDLAPQSAWYKEVNPIAPPLNIPVYNIYGNIQVKAPFHMLGGMINVPTTIKVGDGVLLPGSPSPEATPSLGGAGFYDGNGAVYSETENINEPSLGYLAAHAATIGSSILSSPVFHTAIPSTPFLEVTVTNAAGQKNNLFTTLTNIFMKEEAQ